MYKAIIVDDEIWSLQGIKNMIRWELYGFELIGETTSSAEAKEMIITMQPDIVFTDIHMPEISGLDLMRMAKQRKINSTFVLISGYDSFQYAREAVQLNAIYYLLKPFSQKELDDMLAYIKQVMDERNGIRHDLAEHDNISNATLKKIITFLNNNYMEKLSLNEVCEMYQINPSYCCQLFSKHLMCSFSEYLVALRMNKAAEMLNKQEFTVQELADFLNYDYVYFNKVFKKHFGVSPHKYMKGIRLND